LQGDGEVSILQISFSDSFAYQINNFLPHYFMISKPYGAGKYELRPNFTNKDIIAVNRNINLAIAKELLQTPLTNKVLYLQEQ
jgi:hypothetical protein